jgi:DNA-binding response OmpR family regulator
MKRILLIEDNKDMRENTSEILSLSGYDVLTAKNGKEGVELAIAEKPDLIICDIMMPVLDGFGVLHALSKNEAASSIPFIFLTAKAEKSDLRKGMEMGADDYLTKPFDDIELLNAVETRLKRAELLRKDITKDLDGLKELVSAAGGPNDLRNLTENQEIRTEKARTLIYKEGFYPKGVYFLVKGKVKAYKKHEIGRDYIVSLYGDGDFFGYLALMENKPYGESAETMEESEICFVPKEAFFKLLFANPHVSKKFIHMLANNLADREEQLVRLAYSSVRKRVAETLVALWHRYKKEGEAVFSMDILRDDLASLVGTAKETLIRTLADFRDSGIVETDGRTLIVKNFEKLVAIQN